jgi:hypothetical protein
MRRLALTGCFVATLLPALANAGGRESAHVVVARPESSNGNLVHVGQMLVIPLYDGSISPLSRGYASGLRFIGRRRISQHDLLGDLGNRSMFGGYDAASNRGDAFIVERPGAGSINVTLRLPRLKDRCVSCRTVPFLLPGRVTAV